MTSYVTLSASNGYGQKGAYVARITGTDKKFGLAREFLASPNITECGLYETVDVGRKGKERAYYAVVPTPDGNGIVKVKVREETVFEILATGKSLATLRTFRAEKEGRVAIRQDGKLMWADEEDPKAALVAERERLLARLTEIDRLLNA